MAKSEVCYTGFGSYLFYKGYFKKKMFWHRVTVPPPPDRVPS